MALQAGALGSKFFILIGSGLVGTYVFSNAHLQSLLSDLTKVVSKHLREADRDGGDSPRQDGAIPALAEQVRRLSKELRQLSSSNGRPIVVNAPSAGGSVLSYVVPVACVGVVGYGYMWWKGIKLGDLMYVTTRGMSTAVQGVTKQMEALSGALQSTKRQLAGRLEGVAKDVTESREELGALGENVLDVKEDIAQLDGKMGHVDSKLMTMDGKMETLAAGQEFANRGILLLCRVVMEGMNPGAKPEVMQGLHAYTGSQGARAISTTTSSGLKDIAGLVMAMDDQQQLALPALEQNGGGKGASAGPLPPRTHIGSYFSR